MRLLLVLLAALLASPTFAAPAQDCPRIISQSPYITHALIWLGRAHCIVGASRYDTLKRPQTGGVLDPDMAAIARLHPDLVLASTGTPAEPLERTVRPPARFERLDGFASVDDMLDTLRTIARTSHAVGGEARVELFARAVNGKLAGNPGQGRRVLLLSACTGAPYSFGPAHYVGDVFQRAGFVVVEDAPKIRHLKDGEEVPGIQAQIERTRPDLIINFDRTDSPACNAELGMLTVPVVHVNGVNFFHPGPLLLDGLNDLEQALKAQP